MIDINKLTMLDNVYIAEFDVKVRPYLTLDEIMDIGDTMSFANDLVTQDTLLMIKVLRACTDIPEELLDFDKSDNENIINLDALIQSGLWKAVSEVLTEDITQIYAYVEDRENVGKALARFVNNDLKDVTDKVLDILEKWEKKMPRGKQWTTMLEKLPSELASVLDTFKQDGNAEIVANAMAMNKVGEKDAKNE